MSLMSHFHFHLSSYFWAYIKRLAWLFLSFDSFSFSFSADCVNIITFFSAIAKYGTEWIELYSYMDQEYKQNYFFLNKNISSFNGTVYLSLYQFSVWLFSSFFLLLFFFFVLVSYTYYVLNHLNSTSVLFKLFHPENKIWKYEKI